MAQERGGEELATPRSSGRQEQRRGETGETGGEGAAELIQLPTNAETKWYMVWQSTGSTDICSVFNYHDIALNPTVSGSGLLSLFLLSSMGGTRKRQ